MAQVVKTRLDFRRLPGLVFDPISSFGRMSAGLFSRTAAGNRAQVKTEIPFPRSFFSSETKQKRLLRKARYPAPPFYNSGPWVRVCFISRNYSQASSSCPFCKRLLSTCNRNTCFRTNYGVRTLRKTSISLCTITALSLNERDKLNLTRHDTISYYCIFVQRI